MKKANQKPRKPSVSPKAAKPPVKVVPVDALKRPPRLGFLKGQFKVPEDFDTMCQDEIAEMFGVDD